MLDRSTPEQLPIHITTVTTLYWSFTKRGGGGYSPLLQHLAHPQRKQYRDVILLTGRSS